MADAMILLDVAFATTADRRDAFLALMRSTVAASQVEAGCLTYRLTADINDPLIFHLIELWADEAAFEAHKAGDPFRRFREGLLQCGTVLSSVRRAGPLAPYEPRPA
jgi:quinol monooxygenase YgiN